jgi:orotidine-5'-phosphate decarboxylase
VSPPQASPQTRRPDLAVALDLPEPNAAFDLAERLRPALDWVKIGPVLFLRSGPDGVRRLVDLGYRVFLDLKFHDIPHVVGEACRAAADLGVALLTVHASGGRAMVETAVAAGASAAHLRIVAVTVLTSLGEEDLERIGLAGGSQATALRLARSAVASGAHGVVSSPLELEPLRQALGPRPFLVTPGIRAAADAVDDQARSLDAPAAARLGADLLVVGRPILRARDPVAAARAMRGSLTG